MDRLHRVLATPKRGFLRPVTQEPPAAQLEGTAGQLVNGIEHVQRVDQGEPPRGMEPASWPTRWTCEAPKVALALAAEGTNRLSPAWARAARLLESPPKSVELELNLPDLANDLSRSVN